MEDRKLKLYFKDNFSNAKSITIDYPKVEYTREEVTTAMDQIINSNVIVTKNGPIVQKTKAEIETLNKEEINIA